MKNFKSKTILSTITVLMILSFTVSMFALPGITNAQDKTTTYPFVDAIPNPVGVGQKCLINYGLLNFLYQDGDGWNVTLTITYPNETTKVFDPAKTWSTGTVGQYIIPDVAGTYYIECSFNETVYRNVTYAASKTDKVALVVQENPVDLYPGQSLPDEYWTRPIDSQLREWWTIAGSWVSTPANLYAPYNDGPDTAHILWETPIGDTMGGLVGGDTGDHAYQNGDAYEGKWAGSVIISGVLYYNRYASYLLGTSPQQTIVAVDLHTGETLWEKSFALGNGRISTGQTLYWDCLNSRGAFSYLWIVGGSTWYGVDALTGDLKYNMTNVPSGTNYFGPNGEIMKYQIVNYQNMSDPNSVPDWHLLQWNSSYVVTKDKVGMSESWGSQTQGVTYDATARGFDLNVSLPAYNEASATDFPSTVTVSYGMSILANTTIQKVYPGDKVILADVTYDHVQIWAFDLTPGHEGELLYNTENAAPAEWKEGSITISSIGQAGWAAWSQDDMVAVFWSKENRVHYAYNLTDGKFLWQTEPQIYADAWSDTVTSYGPDRVIAYGNLYSATVGGIVYCYNITTGAREWNYTASDPYHESYLTNNWWIMPTFVTDGKIYFGSCEHSALDPKPRGAPFFALDAITGELVWRADGLFRQSRWGGRAIIGDSVIATQDTYDGQIYGIGKGPSSVTVSAPDVGVAANTAVLIKGTVMDVSPGTQTEQTLLRFPNGVPAVSDESQSEWMLYVYKEFSKPMDVTGVTVKITAVAPNGESVPVGTTTTDASGRFHIEFTPTQTGTYTIYATFEGSGAYYASYAQNEVTVVSGAETTTVANPPYELYTIGTGIAVIIAIALVGLFLAKKHP
jgi:outer membrane protein assembly factor BamB